MQKELDTWKKENTQHTEALRREEGYVAPVPCTASSTCMLCAYVSGLGIGRNFHIDHQGITTD